jgi:hypothetical protein
MVDRYSGGGQNSGPRSEKVSVLDDTGFWEEDKEVVKQLRKRSASSRGQRRGTQSEALSRQLDEWNNQLPSETLRAEPAGARRKVFVASSLDEMQTLGEARARRRVCARRAYGKYEQMKPTLRHLLATRLVFRAAVAKRFRAVYLEPLASRYVRAKLSRALKLWFARSLKQLCSQRVTLRTLVGWVAFFYFAHRRVLCRFV